ncbi:MaoC family dehydratase [Pseudonocardia xinjiangensis]|uniref:MaoC family dehydratase n=1 Tax=Pseudonocardia xinjiangensis TaxID=75289 RepID=UPI003D8BFE5F
MRTTATGSRVLTESNFAVPLNDRYFEDYQAGAVYEYGYLAVTEQSILDFATQFDPQPIHADPSFAATGPFNGLIASGWHSAGLAMRLFADHYLSSIASLASPGVDEVRWRVPLRPDDSVRLRATTLETRHSRSKTDRGLVVTQLELLNQHDQSPMSFKAMNIVRCRAGE